MTNAKQTAMSLYGFHEWPGTHVRNPRATDCRSYACVLLEGEGYSRKQIAAEVGFSETGCVLASIRRFEPPEEAEYVDWSEITMTEQREKRTVNIGIYAEVLDYFKASGDCYSKMNDVLLSYVEHMKGEEHER